MGPKKYFVIGKIHNMKWDVLTEALDTFTDAMTEYVKIQECSLYDKLNIIETIYG
jgi:hypothetical protein